MVPPGLAPKDVQGTSGIPDPRGHHPAARLLDLLPDRSATVYKDWLGEREEEFREGIAIATRNSVPEAQSIIDNQPCDATIVPGAFHVVKIAGGALDKMRRRV